MHNYTPEDLLRYLYRDMSPEEMKQLEAELEKDWTLREKLAVLQSGRARLDQIMESPRTELVLNILRYAHATSPEKAGTPR